MIERILVAADDSPAGLEARSWPADMVVIGRGEQRGAGGPWVGKETRMVLEFAGQPVLVLPRRWDRDATVSPR